MTCNVGGIDRFVRILAGLIILGLGWYFQSWWGLIGLVPLLTGVFRFCPAYVPFNLSSVDEKPQQNPQD